MYPGIFTRMTGLLGDELVYQESGPNGPQAWVVQQVGSLQGRAEAIATEELRGADMSCLGCKLCMNFSEKFPRGHHYGGTENIRPCSKKGCVLV